jgi:hypothetical protein
MITEVDLKEPVDQRLAHFPGEVILSVHIFGVGQEAPLDENHVSGGRSIVSREAYLELTHILEDLFGVLGHHCGVVHIRFVLKYIPDCLNLTAILFCTFRGYLWPDVLGAVTIVLVFVLDHCLDLSNGVGELPLIFADDFLDVHALFVLILDNWGGEVSNLWDALGDTDR